MTAVDKILETQLGLFFGNAERDNGLRSHYLGIFRSRGYARGTAERTRTGNLLGIKDRLTAAVGAYDQFLDVAPVYAGALQSRVKV